MWLRTRFFIFMWLTAGGTFWCGFSAGTCPIHGTLYKTLRSTNIILLWNHIQISGKKLCRVNYHSVENKLAEDLKVTPSSPWSWDVVLEAASYNCFQRMSLEKPREDAKEKIREKMQTVCLKIYINGIATQILNFHGFYLNI